MAGAGCLVLIEKASLDEFMDVLGAIELCSSQEHHRLNFNSVSWPICTRRGLVDHPDPNIKPCCLGRDLSIHLDSTPWLAGLRHPIPSQSVTAGSTNTAKGSRFTLGCAPRSGQTVRTCQHFLLGIRLSNCSRWCVRVLPGSESGGALVLVRDL